VQQVDIVIIDDSRLQWPSVVVIVALSLWLADPGVTMSSSSSMWTAVVHVIDARWAEALIFYVVVVCAGGTLL